MEDHKVWWWRAIRALPEEFVDEQTRLCEYGERQLIACHPEHVAIKFKESEGFHGVWTKVV